MTKATLPGLSESGPTHSIVRVTPELAAAWLALNTKNRTLAQHVVDQYAADMTAGAWKFSGQAIVFDDANRLLDGQHRLSAQVKAGATIEHLVVSGVPTGVQDFIDIGRPRTVANQLQIKGVRFSNAIAATARMALLYEGDRNPSKPTIRIRAEKDLEAFANAGHVGQSIAQVLGGSSSAYSYAHYRLSMLDQDAAAEFFESMLSGANLAAANPILVARQAIARDTRGGTARSWNDSQRVAFVDYLFKTWNLWRDGRQLKTFSRPGGRVEPK